MGPRAVHPGYKSGRGSARPCKASARRQAAASVIHIAWDRVADTGGAGQTPNAVASAPAAVSPPSILLPGLRRASYVSAGNFDGADRPPRVGRHPAATAAAGGTHWPLLTHRPSCPCCRPCPAPDSSSMMRKLSNALGQEGRPGSGSRVHPSGGSTAAAPPQDDVLAAAVDGSAAQPSSSPPGLREQYSPPGEGLQAMAGEAAAATPEASSGSITAQMQRKKGAMRISFADPTVSGSSSPPKLPLVADASASGGPTPQPGASPAPRKPGRTSMLGECGHPARVSCLRQNVLGSIAAQCWCGFAAATCMGVAAMHAHAYAAPMHVPFDATAAPAIRPTDHGEEEYGDMPLDSDRKSSGARAGA